MFLNVDFHKKLSEDIKLPIKLSISYSLHLWINELNVRFNTWNWDGIGLIFYVHRPLPVMLGHSIRKCNKNGQHLKGRFWKKSTIFDFLHIHCCLIFNQTLTMTKYNQHQHINFMEMDKMWVFVEGLKMTLTLRLALTFCK